MSFNGFCVIPAQSLFTLNGCSSVGTDSAVEPDQNPRSLLWQRRLIRTKDLAPIPAHHLKHPAFFQQTHRRRFVCVPADEPSEVMVVGSVVSSVNRPHVAGRRTRGGGAHCGAWCEVMRSGRPVGHAPIVRAWRCSRGHGDGGVYGAGPCALSGLVLASLFFSDACDSLRVYGDGRGVRVSRVAQLSSSAKCSHSPTQTRSASMTGVAPTKASWLG